VYDILKANKKRTIKAEQKDFEEKIQTVKAKSLQKKISTERKLPFNLTVDFVRFINNPATFVEMLTHKEANSFLKTLGDYLSQSNSDPSLFSGKAKRKRQTKISQVNILIEELSKRDKFKENFDEYINEKSQQITETQRDS
jgi:hypothetical protein